MEVWLQENWDLSSSLCRLISLLNFLCRWNFGPAMIINFSRHVQDHSFRVRFLLCYWCFVNEVSLQCNGG